MLSSYCLIRRCTLFRSAWTTPLTNTFNKEKIVAIPFNAVGEGVLALISTSAIGPIGDSSSSVIASIFAPLSLGCRGKNDRL